MRWKFGIFLLLALSLLVAGCGTVTPASEVHTSPLAQASTPTMVPTLMPTVAPTATPTATPTTAPTTTPAAIQLVVLHTNDNWGETEPCG